MGKNGVGIGFWQAGHVTIDNDLNGPISPHADDDKLMTWKEKRDGREGNDEGIETQAKRRRVVVEEGEEGDSRGEAALPDVEGVHRGRPGGAEAWAYAEAVRVDRGDQHEAQEGGVGASAAAAIARDKTAAFDDEEEEVREQELLGRVDNEERDKVRRYKKKRRKGNSEEEGVCVARAPEEPTAEERKLHEATHCPFRSWCRHCLAGRGLPSPHEARGTHMEEDREATVTLGMDFTFLGSGEPGDRACDHPVLVIHETGSGGIRAMALRTKECTLGTVRWINTIVGEFGLAGSAFVLKHDQERSLRALRDELMKIATGTKIFPQEAPKYDSQANGSVERAVQTWTGMFLTLKDAFEHKAKVTLKPDDFLTSWLVAWAAEVHDKCHRHDHGKTSYEFRAQRRWRRPMVPFGETVLFREAAMRKKSRKKGKFKVKWNEGVMLGVKGKSSEYFVGTAEGIHETRDVKRLIPSERWRVDLLEKVNMYYRQHLGFEDVGEPVEGETVTAELNQKSDEGEPAMEAPIVHRAPMLYRHHFERYGFTPGCPACRAIRAGNARIPKHKDECRARIYDKIKGSENDRDRERIERGEMRMKGNREEGDTGDAEKGEQDDHEDEQEAASDSSSSSSSSSSAGDEADDDQDGGRTEARRRNDDKDEGEAEAKRRKISSTVNGLQPAEFGLDQTEQRILHALIRGYDITEAYSLEKVEAVCHKLRLMPGVAMDVRNGWDFSRPADRRRVIQKISQEKPFIIIGSPLLTKLSGMRMQEAMEHLKFCLQLYRLQVREGRYYLHQQVQTTDPREMPEVTEMLDKVVTTLKWDRQYRAMFVVPTVQENKMNNEVGVQFITNSRFVAEELWKIPMPSRARSGMHWSRAVRAAMYTPEFCAAVCKGVQRQGEYDKMNVKSTRALNKRQMLSLVNEFHKLSPPAHWTEANHEDDGTERDWVGDRPKQGTPGRRKLKGELNKLFERDGVWTAWDDVAQVELDPEQVHAARMVEVDYIKKMNVYAKVPRAEAIQAGIKPISTRWIDINKGDWDNPVYRSRLVGKEFNTGVDPSLFAATPPLEALRLVISNAATIGGQRRVVMVNDVGRAFFNAPATRLVYIELPSEDRGTEDLVGRLQMSLYGTRDAAMNWQIEVAKHLKSLGFQRGTAFPGVFYNRCRGLVTMVHGDDYVSSGTPAAVEWLRRELAKKFEIKTSIIGHGATDAREGKVLNRILRATAEGWEYEADQRHGELMGQSMGLQSNSGVKTPTASEQDVAKWEQQPMADNKMSEYRAIAARGNYLGLDRPDLQYAAKETCRDMSQPTEESWRRLKRLARFLQHRPRLVWKYPFQRPAYYVDVYADSNFAGCTASRKSTSGGCIMLGAHLIRTWSKTQGCVTMSSGEAELLAATKGGSEAIGMMTLMAEMGTEARARLHVDAAAALGIAQRQGVGKIRHLDVATLWLQEQEARKRMQMVKIKGSNNPADLFTKGLTEEVILSHLSKMNLEYMTGRAGVATKLMSLRAKTKQAACAISQVTRRRGWMPSASWCENS